MNKTYQQSNLDYMKSSKMIEFIKNISNLWNKYKSGQYGEGCGQYKDNRREKKINLNNILLFCTYSCLVLLLLSVMVTLAVDFRINLRLFVVGVYMACISAVLTILCFGAIILTIFRMWNDSQESNELNNESQSNDARYSLYDSKSGEMTMEEFGRQVTEKLFVWQKSEKYD